MPRDRHVDWNRVYNEERPPVSAVDSKTRLGACVVIFVILLGVVFGRLVQLEAADGQAFRDRAARPVTERHEARGTRGRILARDGTVLAQDETVRALAVRYRYLQEPPDPTWLRSMARARLTRAQRRNPEDVAAAEEQVTTERQLLRQRLAKLCGLSLNEWIRRAARITGEVQRMSAEVHRRRQVKYDKECAALRRTWWDRLFDTPQPPPPSPEPIREELDYHVMVSNVPPEVEAEIRKHPADYPGVRIVDHTHRAYPGKKLASHVIGHLGLIEKGELEADTEHAYREDDRCGRAGLELQYEALLHGRWGEVVESTDRAGRVLSSDVRRKPGVGSDLILTLDAKLQATAEDLLDQALRRRELTGAKPKEAGGAIVVMDVETGGLLVAAATPGFDPGAFVDPQRTDEVRKLLADRAKPLFDRTDQMAIPPGSVFKVVSAIALLEGHVVGPADPFQCQGYLDSPDRWRCEIYNREHHGHGRVTLAGALAQSCNVYFFHHASVLGPDALVDWATRFGFGRPTGVDLPHEAVGEVPRPETLGQNEGRLWRASDTMSLAVGQGTLTVTPLQVARLMAAVANGGRLVTPHLVDRIKRPGDASSGNGARHLLCEAPEGPFRQKVPGTISAACEQLQSVRPSPPKPIAGLSQETLTAVGRGLYEAVDSPLGTAFPTVYLRSVSIAGKTGTAQTGKGRSDHAWFAGYFPAEKPKYALVVVLEHSGDGGEVAGPVAQRMVEAMLMEL
ncbi:MAG: hypothetical protein JW818_14785 [Pirellulales bacterium]|nr:hypothetical protein [Pirellulales bacterium]